jgi:protein TonB
MMIGERKFRAILFLAVAAVHLLALFFFGLHVEAGFGDYSEEARIMKLMDLEELPPPPEAEPKTVVEEIAETMIETDTPPDQKVVAAGALQSGDTFLPMHRVSRAPYFDEGVITQATVYPPIALRSGIEGRVILELFIDRTGRIQRIAVLQENPPGRGFAEAAVKAFEGQRCRPAEANGEPVSVRYRYPISFRLK